FSLHHKYCAFCYSSERTRVPWSISQCFWNRGCSWGNRWRIFRFLHRAVCTKVFFFDTGLHEHIFILSMHSYCIVRGIPYRRNGETIQRFLLWIAFLRRCFSSDAAATSDYSIIFSVKIEEV
uniref:Uncharacterized protein n=1 Tax=Ciona intestinalis TaxID=7719 RepID=F6S5W1_CIOIN